MRYSLLALLNITPTFDNHLENLLLLGIGFLIIIFGLIAGAIIAEGFSKAFETSADWLEHTSAKRKRKRRRTSLRKHHPPHLRVVKSDSAPKVDALAHNALRRNAEASTPAPPHPNMRLVKENDLA